MAKRSLDPDDVSRAIGQIVRFLEAQGESSIPSSLIGERVMLVLATMDDVAYVRYASVYRAFQTAGDFASFLTAESLA